MLEDREPKRIYGTKNTASLKISNALFIWTLVIIILLGTAIISWFGSFYIFGHPENPSSYKILKKLKKIDNPSRFEITNAPRGEFLNAKQIYDRYHALPPRELRKINNVLLRNYLRNFNQTTDRVPYVIGDFNILDSYELTNSDMVPSGVVALAQSKQNPNVLIEHVFPTEPHTTQLLQRALLTGLDINLERKFDLSAIIHIQKLSNGQLLLTAMPIVYGSYASTEGPGTYSLEPPQELHLENSLPFVKDKRLDEAVRKYASYRQRMGLGKERNIATRPSNSSSNYLVRVERPSMDGKSRAENIAQPLPAPARPSTTKERVKVAKAVSTLPVKPVARAEAVDHRSSSSAPNLEPQVARAEPVTEADLPVARAQAISLNEAAASEEPITSSAEANVNLSNDLLSNNEVAAAPAPITGAAAISNTASGKWEVYAPGQMPRGRLLDVPDMPALSSKGVAGERLYLQGDFVVTASGSHRAVLRSQSAVSNPLGGSASNIRIIVDYPAGSIPPEQGNAFSRDAARPFMITDVSPPGPDGHINVRVREITK